MFCHRISFTLWAILYGKPFQGVWDVSRGYFKLHRVAHFCASAAFYPDTVKTDKHAASATGLSSPNVGNPVRKVSEALGCPERGYPELHRVAHFYAPAALVFSAAGTSATTCRCAPRLASPSTVSSPSTPSDCARSGSTISSIPLSSPGTLSVCPRSQQQTPLPT
jgi:hypothetical protein